MYEIVTRTVAGRLLLRPDPELTDRLYGAIGHALARYPVPLYAFNYLSNHGHTMATAVSGDELTAFLQTLHRNIAAAARAVHGWLGKVLVRFSAIPILDDEAALRRLRYVLANGVKEGLVAHPLAWPGASSAAAMLSETPIPTTWREALGPGRAPRIEKNDITLTPLPVWRDLEPAQRRARLSRMFDDIAAEARVARGGKPPLGVAAVMSMHPYASTPLESHPAPLAHFTDAAALADYVRDRNAFIDAHRASTAEQQRRGEAVAYPLYGFPAAPPFRVG